MTDPERDNHPESLLYPLFMSSNSKYRQQCKLLWHCYQFHQHIQNTNFDFTTSSPEQINEMSQKFNLLIGIQKILSRSVTTGYLPDQQQQNLSELFENELSKFQAQCNFESPITREMPELPDDKQIRLFLHDMANNMSIMSYAFSIPDPKSAQKLFSQSLNYFHTTIRKAYTQIGKEVLPAKPSMVLLEDFDKEITNMFWLLESTDKRYRLIRDREFINSHGDTTFWADPVDLSGFVANIIQNIQRVYDERDRRNPSVIANTRMLTLIYGVEDNWVKVIFEDEAIGFDKDLLDAGRFIKGRSTLGGEGLGLYDYQNRFENLGILMELYNHSNGARLTVLFPIKTDL